MNLVSLIERNARSRGKALAATGAEGEGLCWEEVLERVRKVSGGLAGQGVGAGDRVAVLLRNSPEFLVDYFGILHAGAVAVPLNTRWTSEEMEFALRDSGTELMFTTTDLLEPVESLLRSGALQTAVLVDHEAGRAGTDVLTLEAMLETAEPNRHAAPAERHQLAEIMYTAGSTGRPKGVPHSHGFLETAALSKGDFFEIGADDVGLSISPLFHIGGLGLMLIGVAAGAQNVFLPKWEVEPFLAAIERHCVTYMHLVTTLLVDLARRAEELQGRYDTSSLRVTYGGGGTATQAQYEFFEREIGGVFCDGYSRTETTGVAYNPPEKSLRKRTEGAISIGRILENVVTVRIVDENGCECSPGDVGEILLRGDGVVDGYWNLPELTGQTFDADGWMHTGDMGSVDADGFLAFVGRIDGMIKTGGENVYPADVEATLLMMPGVAEAAVVGIPDERLGTMVAALIVPESPGMIAEEVEAWCRGRMGSFKRPRFVVIADELHKLGSRKIDYRAVAEVLTAARSAK